CASYSGICLHSVTCCYPCRGGLGRYSGESRLSVFAFSGGLSQFEQWWQLQGEWVEEPNQRRGGESGVQRLQVDQGQLLYAKRQVGHLCRSLSHPFGRPTVLRERDALLGLSRL